MNVLVIEDSENKLEDILKMLNTLGVDRENVTISKNFVSGRNALKSSELDLAIIDISIDISSRTIDPSKENHANIGGFQLIEIMSLNEKIVPTIIVTGFSSFFAERGGGRKKEIQSLDQIIGTVENWLGDKFIGCVRYSEPNWKDAFQEYFKKVSS